MKILHLSTQDIAGGGGGFDASYRLHCNMRSAGVDSVMAVLHKESDDHNIIDISSCFTFTDRLRWLWSKFFARYARIRYVFSPYFYLEAGTFLSVSTLVDRLPFQPNAIIVHWVSNFLSTDIIHQLNVITGAPIFWYMMDMAPLTGGCHYAFDCKGYTLKCGNCPQVQHGRNRFDISRRQWQRKFNNFISTQITAVVPTSWLMRQAMESSIFCERSVKQIMLGIDVNIFKPIPKLDARSKLELPFDKKIIFFGAQRLHEERKGISYLVEALKKLYALLEDNSILRRNIIVVTAGEILQSEQLDIFFEHRHIGFLKGDILLAAGYQAADVFVNASIEDSGPMMINESILCGTPVVSFDMGVAPDLVHSGKTGYRARLRDTADMAAGLLSLLEMDEDNSQTVRVNCRKLGLQLCHPNVQVKDFLKLCLFEDSFNDSLKQHKDEKHH